MSKPRSLIDTLAEHVAEAFGCECEVDRVFTDNHFYTYGGPQSRTKQQYYLAFRKNDAGMAFGPCTINEAKARLAMLVDLKDRVGLFRD